MANVIVPSPDFRATPQLRDLWMGTGGWFLIMKTQVGEEMALSLLFSRATRELRRVHGAAEAKDMLHKLAESMDEAARYDLPNE